MVSPEGLLKLLRERGELTLSAGAIAFNVTRTPVQREMKVLQSRGLAYIARWKPPATFGSFEAIFAPKVTGAERDALKPSPLPKPKRLRPWYQPGPKPQGRGTVIEQPAAVTIASPRIKDDEDGIERTLPERRSFAVGIDPAHVELARARARIGRKRQLGPWAGL